MNQINPGMEVQKTDKLSFNTVPEEYLIYKYQNKHVEKPVKLSGEFDIDYVDWMNYRENIFEDMFSEERLPRYHLNWRYFYQLVYEQEIILDTKKIDIAIRNKRGTINYFITEEAEQISDNAECVREGIEPPNMIRGSYIDSYDHKDGLDCIVELKRIKKLISYNKEKKRKIVDWKKTAENIFKIHYLL